MGSLKVKVGTIYERVARGAKGESGAITGEIKLFAGAEAVVPSGYRMCDGSSVLRTAYPELFAIISTTYGEGDTPGSTFNLPDLRVRIPIGAGTGKALGADDGVAEASRNARHSHTHTHVATSSGSISGTVGNNTTSCGISGGIFAADTNHNHTTNDYTHTTNSNTAGASNLARLVSPATHNHGSTSLAVQPGGQTHAHGHNIAVSDPGHGHTFSGTTSVGTTVENGGSNAHPFQTVNYIIKT